MARRKKTRSRPSGRTKRGFELGSALTSRAFLTAVIALVLSVSAGYGVYYFFMETGFFEIKEVSFGPHMRQQFPDAMDRLKRAYVGRNIFRVDLRQTASMLKNEYVHINKVEVTRVMPDKLEVRLLVRRPVAFVDAGRGVIIDKEGVVLPADTEHGDLTVIKGVKFLFGLPQPGERIKKENVSRALMLIEAIGDNSMFDRYDISYVDVSDDRNLMMDIGGMKIKLGSGDFSSKIKKLSDMLEDPEIRTDRISYIDLRFDEAIIAPK